MADVKALNFVDYYLFVELRVNQRQYKIHSLPGIVAGLTTTYHQAEESIWGKQLEYARTRRIVPDAEKDTGDTTGYSKLGPGVRTVVGHGSFVGPQVLIFNSIINCRSSNTKQF